MMKLGYNCSGTELEFERMLELAWSKSFVDFRYLEHGIAEGQTLLSVYEKAIQLCQSTQPFRTPFILGLDLPNGPFFDAKKFLSRIENATIMQFCDCDHLRLFGGMNVWLSANPELSKKGYLFTFILIDGCHGKACAMNDFKRYENLVVPGGIVAFHDACEEDQGKGFQHHCNEPINVRAGLKELGLLDDTRAGWKSLGEAHGDKSKEGNGFAFFQKI